MKNDIIGSFGILILAVVLVILVSQSDNMDLLWWGNLDISSSASENNGKGNNNDNGMRSMEEFIATPTAEVTNTSVVTQYVEDGENCTTSCKVDWKKMPAIPYLNEELTKKYAKKYVVETQVGQYFLWPQNKQKYSNVTNADALVMESVHDPSGKTLNDQRAQISKVLKKLGFKQTKKSDCLIPGNYDFADCLDYYERENDRCLSMVIYEPMNRTDVKKVEAKVVQTKVICGTVQ